MTALSNSAPFFSGGVFISMLLHFSQKSRRKPDKTYESINDRMVFRAYVESITGEPWIITESTLKTNVSYYRNCSSIKFNVPLEDAGVASAYDRAVRESYQVVLDRMDCFARNFLSTSEDHVDSFVKGVIETIYLDNTIPLSQHFYISGGSIPSTKKQMYCSEKTITLSGFLVGVTHFLLQHRRGKNPKGRDTLDAWAPVTKNNKRDFTLINFGASIHHDLKIVPPSPEYRSVSDGRTISMRAIFNPDDTEIPSIELLIKNTKADLNIVVTAAARETPAEFDEIFVRADLGPQYASLYKMPPRITDPSVTKLECYSHHIKIVGDAGFGKSMLMRYFYYQLATEYESTGIVPIFLTARYFQLNETISDFVLRMIHTYCTRISEDDLAHLIESSNTILLFDGIDELHATELAAFQTQMNSFKKLYPNITIVMSTRPQHHDSNFNGFLVFQCLPLTKAQALELVDRATYWDHEAKATFRKALDDHIYNEHPEFAGVPLLLTILMVTYKYFEDVPSNPYEFIQMLYDVLTIGHDATKDGFVRALFTSLEIETYKSYLEEILFRFYCNKESEFTKEQFCLCAQRVIDDSPVNTGAAPIDFFYDATESTSLMKPVGIKYATIHRTLQELLAAHQMCRQMHGKEEHLIRFFEMEKHGWVGDITFDFLYIMGPSEIDARVFYPFLRNTLRGFDDGLEGYWQYLHRFYPKLRIFSMPNEHYIDMDPDTIANWLGDLPTDHATQSATSFLYNAFMKTHNLSKLHDLQNEEWLITDLASFNASFIVFDGDRDSWGTLLTEKRVQIYEANDENRRQWTNEDFLDQVKWLGYYAEIDTRSIYDGKKSRYAALYEMMSNSTFSLYQEYTALCTWVESTAAMNEHDRTVESAASVFYGQK